MKKLEAKVDTLIVEELAGAEMKFKPLNTGHEGYAVILEELEEGMEEIEQAKECLDRLWQCVKANDSSSAVRNAASMEERARKAACELIQVAAMAKRFAKDIK